MSYLEAYKNMCLYFDTWWAYTCVSVSVASTKPSPSPHRETRFVDIASVTSLNLIWTHWKGSPWFPGPLLDQRWRSQPIRYHSLLSSPNQISYCCFYNHSTWSNFCCRFVMTSRICRHIDSLIYCFVSN